MKLGGGDRHTCKMKGGGRPGACPWWGGGGGGGGRRGGPAPSPLEMEKKDAVTSVR